MSDPWRPLRVQRLALSRFKAYAGTSDRPISIDFDNADIVLVVGANGRGKTSIVEALELVLTGTYQARVGDEKLDWKKTRPFDDLIHQGGTPPAAATRGATIQVDWAAADGASLGREEVEVLPERVTAAGTWGERRARPGVDLTRVRATTLFYAESLSGMLGGDRNARKMTFDAYIGELPEVKSLADQIGDHLVPLIQVEVNKVQAARAEVTRATNVATAAAEVLGRAWSEASGSPLSLLKAGGEWSDLNLRRGLKQMGVTLRVTVAEPTPETLLALRRAAEERAAVEREAQLAAAATGGATTLAWTRVSQTLHAADSASRKQRRTDLASMDLSTVERELEETQRALDEWTQRETSLKAQLTLIWSTVDVDGPDGRQRVPAGTLPLLLLLARPEGATVAGALGLEAPEPAALASQIAQERARYEEMRSSLRQQLVRSRDGKERRQELEDQRALLRAGEALWDAWTDATNGEPLPVDRAGALDLDLVRSRTERQIGPPTRLPDWSGVASALGRLGEAIQALQEAMATVHDSTANARALSELTKLAELAGSLASSDKRGLYPSVRARLIGERYQGKFHEATRAVLAAYDHHARVGRGLRVDFTNDGSIQVRVESRSTEGAGASSATGALSLSRSQLISVSFALAIAANLGQEQPPIGFICLDDIADALDVDNLAAEATLLRRLAYSHDAHARRQLIITSHNRELTDRLVPLLLPPPGRKMRIVEVTERRDGDISEVHPEVFEVQTDKEANWKGRSPLREILPSR